MCSKFVLRYSEKIRSTFRHIGRLTGFAAVFVAAFLLGGCVANNQPSNQAVNVAPANTNSQLTANTNTAPGSQAPAYTVPITLPVIDAMFADDSFAGEIKSKLGLTDEQVSKLQQASRDAVLSLDEADENASTKASTERANTEVKKIIGEEKTKQLFDLVSQRWSGADQESLLTGRPNTVPTDTRIVVNAPAYRMDIFKDGKLTRTYKVGIGYPEFPLPRGLRKAEKIIFNPEWTPPDEPWVKGKFAPGKKVEAGSKDNPLGLIKIPIGLPSLIHGGKNPAKLGTFASHGCVGLTNKQVEVFAAELAGLSGNQLSPDDVKNYQKDRSKTQELKLQSPVPVELRYETIVVEDGKVHIYRDVYELGTNTEENLRKVLSAYEVNFDDLDPAVKAGLLDALKSMAVDAKGQPVTEEEAKDSKTPSNARSGKVTSAIKGNKEMIIEVPQLSGKGYPAAVNFMAS